MIQLIERMFSVIKVQQNPTCLHRTVKCTIKASHSKEHQAPSDRVHTAESISPGKLKAKS